jgi:hypothetical protein
MAYPIPAGSLDQIHSSAAFYFILGIATHDIVVGADGKGLKQINALEKYNFKHKICVV